MMMMLFWYDSKSSFLFQWMYLFVAKSLLFDISFILGTYQIAFKDPIPLNPILNL